MEKALKFLKDKITKKPSDYIVVACSGGPDSIALLHLCLTLQKEINFKIVCAHVNHNVREESESEKEFVKEYCGKNNIIFEYMKIENYGDDNFENEARVKRYQYFDSIIEKYQASYLLTAHHGDDLIETVLMRLTRGSTLKGYSGFNETGNRNNYEILRPLIWYTKEELMEYNSQNGLEYVVDKTNQMDIHTRNRYRKYILPKLKEEDKNVHDKFYKFSKMLLEYNEYIDKQVDEKFRNVYQDGKIIINEFLKLDKLIGRKVIELILEGYYKEELSLINDKHTEMIEELIHSSKSNISYCLPNDVQVIKSYGVVYLEQRKTDNKDYEIELIKDVVLKNDKKISFIDDTDNNSNFICRLDSSEICLPLIVRNKRTGDKMIVKGLNGTKKIKDIFIDCKVPACERDSWPIVTDSKNCIVWLPGLKKSQFDKKISQKYDIIIKYD